MIKIIPKKKKFRKAKWLSEEAEQIAEKIREVKGKREKERYTNLNIEFRRRARRDKIFFLINSYFLIKKIFTYLAMLGVSCHTRDLRSSLQMPDLYSWHANS